MATLTYDYQDSTAVLGPLATSNEPHAYDLCEIHADSLTAPRGWQVVRLTTRFDPAPPSSDDLLALVDAVRQAAATGGKSSSRVAANDPAPESPAPKAAPAAPRDVEYGPFRDRHQGLPEAQDAQDTDLGDIPELPAPWDERRARFRVISEDEGGVTQH